MMGRSFRQLAKMNKRKCSHRKSWIICGGAWVWCYECGAITVNKYRPKGFRGWVLPVGPGGENPLRGPNSSESLEQIRKGKFK